MAINSALSRSQGQLHIHIDCIRSDVREALAKPAVIEKLKTQLIAPYPSTPEEMRAKIDNEKKLWADVIKAADIKIN